MNLKNFVITVRLILFVLFIYAGISKIMDLATFQEQLYQSPIIPKQFVPILMYLLPVSEFMLAVMLAVDKLISFALSLSFALMLFFSLYLIGLVLFFTKVPCACGGILGNMGYPAHIAFNIVITLITAVAILEHERLKKMNSSFDL